VESLLPVFALLVLLLLVAGFVAGIVLITRAARHRPHHAEPFSGEHWYMIPFSSGTDLLSQLLAALGVALGAVALTLAARQLGWGLSTTGALLLGSLSAVALSYWLRGPLLLAFGIVGVVGWAGQWLGKWTPTFSAQVVVVLAGMAVLALCSWLIGRFHEGFGHMRRFGFVYWILGAFGLVVVLFWASSQAGLAAITASNAAASIRGSWRVALGLSLLAVAAAGLLGLDVSRKRISVPEAIALAVILLVFVAFVIFPPAPAAAASGDLFSGTSAKLTPSGMAWAIVFNLVLLASLLGIVFTGYAEREDWIVTLGAVLLFAFVAIKYFDWLFTFLDRSLAFVVAGLLLIAVGFLMERGRRYVIQSMAEDGTDG
jgi:hypothetical protein